MVCISLSVLFLCVGVGVTSKKILPMGEGLLAVLRTHRTILVGSEQSLSHESLQCDITSYAQSMTMTVVLPHKIQEIYWIPLLVIIKTGKVNVMSH